jgi:hypothetical protein
LRHSSIVTASSFKYALFARAREGERGGARSDVQPRSELLEGAGVRRVWAVGSLP